MNFTRSIPPFTAIALAMISAILAPAPAHAEVMTATNPVVYVFELTANFSFERIAINFQPGSTSFRFDYGESIKYQVGSAPYTEDFGVGYHHQGSTFGSYGYSSSIRSEDNSFRVEFPVPAGTLYVTANYVNGDVAIDSMNINDNAGTTYVGQLFSPPLTGDLDGDGFVGIADLNIVLGAWNQSAPPADTAADPSGDGFVGIEDLNAVLGNWNAGTPPADNTAVPEPASVLLLTTATLATLTRRR
jgi:hypothetical protein